MAASKSHCKCCCLLSCCSVVACLVWQFGKKVMLVTLLAVECLFTVVTLNTYSVIKAGLNTGMTFLKTPVTSDYSILTGMHL